MRRGTFLTPEMIFSIFMIVLLVVSIVMVIGHVSDMFSTPCWKSSKKSVDSLCPTGGWTCVGAQEEEPVQKVIVLGECVQRLLIFDKDHLSQVRMSLEADGKSLSCPGNKESFLVLDPSKNADSEKSFIMKLLTGQTEPWCMGVDTKLYTTRISTDLKEKNIVVLNGPGSPDDDLDHTKSYCLTVEKIGLEYHLNVDIGPVCNSET